MKKIFAIALISFLFIGRTNAQTYMNSITAKNNAGTAGQIKMYDYNLKVYDSAVATILAAGIPIKIGSTTPTLGATANQSSIAGLIATAPIGIYNATPPTITDGRYNNFQIDVNGYLKVNLAAGNDSTNLSRKYIKISAFDASLPSGTNYMGKVRLTDGTNDQTFMSTTTSSKYGADENILSILGTAPTEAGKIDVKSTIKPSYGATVSMTITNLSALGSSATVGWQSAKVSNLSTLATDYEINIKLTMANTAPANDKAVYVYVVPFYTSDAGTTWYAADQGTTTLPTGSEGASTIASPNDLFLLGVMNYTTQNMVLQKTFYLSSVFGKRMPDAWSIIIINFTGAAVATTSGSNNIVQYSPINDILK